MSEQSFIERPRLPSFNISDPDFLSDALPTAMRAHKEAPVFFDDMTNSWVVTGYKDVAAILSDHQTYSSRAVGRIPPPADIAVRAPDFAKDEIIVNMDPPDHTPARNVIQLGFAKKIVDPMSHYTEIVADEVINSVIGRGECNFINDICHRISLGVIIELLGLPKEYADDYARWGEALFSLLVPKALDSDDYIIPPHLSEDQVRGLWNTLADANALLREIVLLRQKNPGSDLISAMISARAPDGSAIDPGAVVRHSLSLIGAGYDTTATLLAHLVLHFTRNPDQLALLKAAPSLAANAAEEGMRRQGPAVSLARITTKDVVLQGQHIPRGSMLCLLICAANLDPDIFPDPGKFDIQRTNANRHLSLGRGRHACAGQPLARAEAPVALRKLYERMSDLHIDLSQPILYAPAYAALKVTSMPAKWTPPRK